MCISGPASQTSGYISSVLISPSSFDCDQVKPCRGEKVLDNPERERLMCAQHFLQTILPSCQKDIWLAVVMFRLALRWFPPFLFPDGDGVYLRSLCKSGHHPFRRLPVYGETGDWHQAHTRLTAARGPGCLYIILREDDRLTNPWLALSPPGDSQCLYTLYERGSWRCLQCLFMHRQVSMAAFNVPEVALTGSSDVKQ